MWMKGKFIVAAGWDWGLVGGFVGFLFKAGNIFLVIVGMIHFPQKSKRDMEIPTSFRPTSFPGSWDFHRSIPVTKQPRLMIAPVLRVRG